jgi:hypothetical protein
MLFLSLNHLIVPSDRVQVKKEKQRGIARGKTLLSPGTVGHFRKVFLAH